MRGPARGGMPPPGRGGRGPQRPLAGAPMRGRGGGGRFPSGPGPINRLGPPMMDQMGRYGQPPPPPRGFPGGRMDGRFGGPDQRGRGPPGPPMDGRGWGPGRERGMRGNGPYGQRPPRGVPPPPPPRPMHPNNNNGGPPGTSYRPPPPPPGAFHGHPPPPPPPPPSRPNFAVQPPMQPMPRQMPPAPPNYRNTSMTNIPSTAVTTVHAPVTTPTTFAAPYNTAQTHLNVPSTTTTSSESIENAWTEHLSPAGVHYYYNSITKESTYDKPEALKKKGPTIQSASTTPVSTVAAVSAPAAVAAWAEYTDPNTGKKYYSNGVTTSWEKPTELSTVSSTSTKADTEPEEPARKKKKVTKKESPYSNKEEAVAAFKGLLLAKDIAPSLKWHEVTKVCGSDPRWEDTEVALTTGERKQALAEYQTKRANELRTMERQERARAKEAFNKLLSSSLPAMEGFSASNSRFSDFRDSLSKDDRFHAVADESIRESLFLDFCEEQRKREERKKRNQRRDAQEAFVEFLREKNESGALTYASTWESFVASLDERDQKDSRFAVISERSDQDRQLFFADFVIELQTEEDHKRRRIREARERAELEQQKAYREHLAQLAEEGKLLPASRWRNVEELVSSHPSFAPVQAQGRDAPGDIFEEFANTWNSTYRSDRTFLSQLVYPSSKSDEIVKAETTYDEFTQALLHRASESGTPDVYAKTKEIIHLSDPVSSARLYFNELSMRARGVAGPAVFRKGSALRRRDSESSEDEGEIVEDGEML